MSKLLVVDDDPNVRTSLRRMLSYEGYQVSVAQDGRAALSAALDHMPDLVILDLMLPGIDGYEVCRRMREVDDVPILMLTARDGTKNEVMGLDAGADDYLSKPFVKEQLLARIRALLRRRSGERHQTLRFADLVLDDRAHEVRRGDRAIDLTAREYELLHFLMGHAGEVVSQSRLLASIWGYSNSRVVEVYIGYVREKLELGGESRLVHTVRGVGYIMRLPDKAD